MWQRCQSETFLEVSGSGRQHALVRTLADRFSYARSQSREYRDPHGGLTALAEKIGTEKSTLSRYESGERKSGTYPILKLAARELGVRVEWLMDGTQPMREDGTRAPEARDAVSLEDFLELHPNRWHQDVVAAVRAAYARRGSPEGGWGRVLDQMTDLVIGKPSKPKRKK